MKHKTNKAFLLGVASLTLASCADEMYIFSGANEGEKLTFTATMNEQDWYGTNAATRGVLVRDEIIPTDFVNAQGKRINLTSHEVNGISGERVRLDDQRTSRAIMTNAIDTRKLSISQVGFTQGNGTNTPVELLNMEALTTDGNEWSCNEFFANRRDFTALRIFGSLFPYSENYVVKTDDYDNEGAMVGSLPWLYHLRADYELASDSSQLQEDLLYAKQIRSFTGDGYASDGATPLEFRHAMTAVKVKLGSTGFVPAVIKEVRLLNVHNKGTLHFFDKYTGAQEEKDMVSTTGWWEVTDSKTNCVAVTDFDTQGEYNCYVTGDAATFMMIPQELPADATLELDIVFNSDPEENVVTISAPIGKPGDDNRPKYWNIGTTHEYIISTNENVDGYYMVMEGINNSERAKYVDADGGNASITLKSYKTSETGTGERAPLAWKYMGWSYDGEEMQDVDAEWLHMTLADGTPVTIGTEGVGCITGEVINIQIDAMAEEKGVEHKAILRSREAKGSVTNGAYDLSRHEFGTGKSIGTTTANSYVIDAPGHYTFPTIYGNAMKDGSANTAAFGLENGVSATGSPKGTSFVDYLDRQIVSPLIQYNTKLSRAALVWEDVEGLVTDVKLTQRGDFVDFRIDRDNIDQGNAVIAVYDQQDRIVWSWHIWVTDEDITATVPTGTGSYKAMPVNLGWKSSVSANAVRGRDIYLHFAQGETEDDFVFYQTTLRITQRSEYKADSLLNHKGSSPYYQWGRKDPMVGAVDGKSVDVYTYGARSFYCENLTTWAVPEWLSVVNKAIIFTGAVAIGIATGGTGWLALGGALAATAGGAGMNLGLTKLQESYCATTDKWGTTIGYAIQNPTCDIKSAMTWTDCKNHDPYHDLWGIGQNTDNRSKKVVKTIYDPCPVGFHVPEGNAFDGMHRGYNDGLDNGKMYLPACGGRIDYIHGQSMEGNFDVVLLQNGSGCGYWTAAPCKKISGSDNHDHESYRRSEGAFALVADKDNSGVTKDSYEAWGYNMRPVADY